MSKHSPAPWHFNSYQQYEGETEVERGYFIQQHQGPWLALLPVSVTGIDDLINDVVTANARLMAAAPDLSDALWRYLEHDDCVGGDCGIPDKESGETWVCAHCQAWKAMNKAHGGSRE